MGAWEAGERAQPVVAASSPAPRPRHVPCEMECVNVDIVRPMTANDDGETDSGTTASRRRGSHAHCARSTGQPQHSARSEQLEKM